MPSESQDRSPLDTARHAVQSWTRHRILDVIQGQLLRRREYWASTDDAPPTLSDIDSIVRIAAAKSAGMSAGCTVAPGLLGAATIPAELVLSVQLATSMVVDIAIALDAESELTPDLVAQLIFDEGRGILAHLDPDGDASSGTARQVIGTAAGLVGRHSAKRLLKMVFGRIVPVVGAGGMALWTWRSTNRIADAARNVFSLQEVLGRTADEGTSTEALAAEVAEHVAEQVADDVSSVKVPSEPAKPRESERTRRARHALLGNGLRAISDPSRAQRKAFDDLFPESTWDNAEAVLSRPEDLALNRPLLASIDEQQLWEDIATIVGDGHSPSEEWTQEVGALFGMDAEDLEARVHELAA